MEQKTNIPIPNTCYSCRQAKNSDATIIRQIIFDTLESYGLSLDPADTDKDLYDIESYYPNNTFWVIVEQDGTIKGSFALFHWNNDKAEIRKMYFHSSIRGLGIGSWVMKYLVEKAIAMGYHMLKLETASVLKEAISLYKKYHFIHTDGIIHSHRCDVVMIRHLHKDA
ncbi:MAG: GNAT family N-acetyltransferase [Saprospiraceae bacterium]|nr:GNAT family N-acetyltransferase [Saprospiraceae bacterium]